MFLMLKNEGKGIYKAMSSALFAQIDFIGGRK